MTKKFKFTPQLDLMGCGVACLSMISKYYGKTLSISYLSLICNTSAEGVSLLSIAKTANKIGFRTIGAESSLDALANIHLPCILHWNQNHFVVLYKINSKKNLYYIADPGEGMIKMNQEEFSSHWIGNNVHRKGFLLALKPQSSFFDMKDTIPHSKLSHRKILQYLVEYRSQFILILLGLLIGCMLQLAMPFLAQGIVDVGIKHKNLNIIWLILLGEFLIILGKSATDFIRNWLLIHISMRINITLLSDFFIKLLQLPMSYFDTKRIGDLLQRMHDHTRIQSFLTSKLLNISFSILSLIILGLVLYMYTPLLFSIYLIASIFYGLWISYFLEQRKEIDYKKFELQSTNQELTVQFMTTIQEIKLQNCENRRRWEWEDKQADLYDVELKAMALQQKQEAGSVLINEIKNIFITFCAATSVIGGEITIGAMIAIQYIVGQLNSPIEQIMNFIYSLQDVKLSLDRINNVYNSPNELNRKEGGIQGLKNKRDISLQTVYFKYNAYNKNFILNNITLYIPEGKVTAIVGASGSGKSTLLKLILGYYKPNSGTIHISGVNINKYDLTWWRKQCGVVMQDGVIFAESIGRNIAIDDSEIDFQKMYNAAKVAQIHEFIKSLPLKYETKIGLNGIGLSQGQKQRILIARAVYKQAPFLFFDEATNSLDANNEYAIVENLSEIYKNRTVIVVAHRLSTVKKADQIVVLNNGMISEVGKHDDLISKRGYYYTLIKNQLELGG